jgi:Ni,Fe-hydrogenase III large subunit
MPYTIPIGPYHPALEEPYKLGVSCRGETITGVTIEVGYSSRSIELLAQRRNYVQNIVLVEHVCGICSGVHTMTFAMAAEALLGLRIPDRARYIRVIIAELERLHSHLLWAGIAAEDIGFQTMFMAIFALRERVMDVLEAISGNRVHYGMNCIGGVNGDVPDPEMILSAIIEVRDRLEREIVPIFTDNPTIRSRAAGVGLLSKANALLYGAVGPLARASGLPMDVRCDMPYAAYDELNFQIVTASAGDVFARITVRALEMLESVRLIELALRKMPSGPVRLPGVFTVVPPGEITTRAEAPRGEVIYYLEADGSDTPQRLRIRTPTFVNLPAIEAMCVGQQLADLPLIQASVDPCNSCVDR